MAQKYDFSQLMKKTRAVEVTLDRPRSMSYTMPAIQAFVDRFGVSVTAWLKQYVDDDGEVTEPPIEDMYFIAWLGFHDNDETFSFEEFQRLISWPVLNALYKGPVLQALIGYGDLEN